ncbi:MAG: RNA polymerase sigma factor [Bacteroidales bacterium]|nr:RNA polymerase sigma factor [Bacteroidales bacterium]
MQSYDEEKVVQLLSDPQTIREGFEWIVKKYSEQLYWQIRRMVLVHEDADDVLQNTFIKAWNYIDSFRGEAKLSTWLYRIAYNESITFLNASKNQIGKVNYDDSESFLIERLESDPYFSGDKIQVHLQEAILLLPEKQKEVFRLRYFEDMPYEEISELTGTSVGGLKASYHHAVKKIEEYFMNID